MEAVAKEIELQSNWFASVSKTGDEIELHQGQELYTMNEVERINKENEDD